MKAVWKFPLRLSLGPVEHVVEMPGGAEVLHVGVQGGDPTLWALVDPDKTVGESRTFRLVGTGHREVGSGMRFVGTALVSESFVLHVFEVSS